MRLRSPRSTRRTVRSLVVAAAVTAVAAGGLMLTGGSAVASTTPATDLSAVTVEGAKGAYPLESGHLEYTGTAVTATTYANAVEGGAGDVGFDLFGPSNGTPLAVGRYVVTTDPSTSIDFGVGVGGRGCSNTIGSVVQILQIERDPGTGAISSFAASYSESCGGTGPLVGEFRWHSTVPYERFGASPLGTTTATHTITVTPTVSTTFGTAVLEGDGAPTFRTGADTCSGATVAAGSSCTIAVTAHLLHENGVTATLRVPSASGDQVVGLTAVGVDTANGAYQALAPARVLDTRAANGVSTRTPLGAGQEIEVPMLGRGGVPGGGVSAVVLNLTVTAPSFGGFVTVYPAGVSRPNASSINFAAGWTGANLVTVPLGTGGRLRFYNALGSTHVIADVVGFYHSATSTQTVDSGLIGDYTASGPQRLVDTRSEGQPLHGGYYEVRGIDYGAANNQRLRALALNVTVVNARGNGFLTVWDGISTMPSTSTLNFRRGQTVANMVVVKPSQCAWQCNSSSYIPSYGFVNNSDGDVDVLVDVVGVYFAGQEGDRGWRYRPLATPTRFVDSRSHLGLAAPLGQGQTQPVVVPSPVGQYNTYAVVSNVTAVNPTMPTFLTLWANDGSPKPGVSNLNPAAHSVVANMAITEVWTANDLRIYNAYGTTQVLMDAAGTMEHYPLLLPPSTTAGTGGASREASTAATGDRPAPPSWPAGRSVAGTTRAVG